MREEGGDRAVAEGSLLPPLSAIFWLFYLLYLSSQSIAIGHALLCINFPLSCTACLPSPSVLICDF